MTYKERARLRRIRRFEEDGDPEDWRNMARKTLLEVAQELGVSVPTLKRFERGVSDLERQSLDIAHAYDCPRKAITHWRRQCFMH